MVQPALNRFIEMERSDNFRFSGEYWCVVRYDVILDNSYKKMFLVVVFHAQYIQYKYWRPTKQRLFTMEHAAENYYNKVRSELMIGELQYMGAL